MHGIAMTAAAPLEESRGSGCRALGAPPGLGRSATRRRREQRDRRLRRLLRHERRFGDDRKSGKGTKNGEGAVAKGEKDYFGERKEHERKEHRTDEEDAKGAGAKRKERDMTVREFLDAANEVKKRLPHLRDRTEEGIVLSLCNFAWWEKEQDATAEQEEDLPPRSRKKKKKARRGGQKTRKAPNSMDVLFDELVKREGEATPEQMAAVALERGITQSEIREAAEAWIALGIMNVKDCKLRFVLSRKEWSGREDTETTAPT